jgi:hypothetical protein
MKAAKKARSSRSPSRKRRLSSRDALRVVPTEYIQRRIQHLRGQKVIIDSDLAALYGVTTSSLNLAVRRNRARFPSDFMFQMTKEEAISLLFQIEIAKRRRGGRQTPPYAFTEFGVAMLSSVLKSERAVQINILIMRAFVKLRAFVASNEALSRHLDEIEARLSRELAGHDRKLSTHEQAITGILKTLRGLMDPPQVRAIGLTADISKR